jgi:UPF0716 protein FxsA
MPAGSLIDGVMILIAGALLVTPGMITDAFGFLCLIPAFRRAARRVLLRRLEKAIAENRVHVSVDFAGGLDGLGGPGPPGPKTTGPGDLRRPPRPDARQPGRPAPPDTIDAEWRRPDS